MRTPIIIAMCAVTVCACRSHKECDLRVAEQTQTQTTEQMQTRTDSRTDASAEQAEAADSVVWTMSADSVVQTKADGTREVLHRVLWARTAYKPTATAKATATAQRTDTTSAVTQAQAQHLASARSHNESSRGGRPWWALVLAVIATTILIYYARRWKQSRFK